MRLQRFDHPGLIAAERATALQYQRDAVGQRQGRARRAVALAARANWFGIGHPAQMDLLVQCINRAFDSDDCNPWPRGAF